MKNEANEVAAAARGPRRSRMISKVALPLTAATRPGHVREQADAEDADRHDPDQRQTETGADDGVGDEIADVEESSYGGEDAERHREDLRHQR